MVSWSGDPDVPTARWYREFAEQDAHGVSPLYEVLCLGVAADAEMCGRLDTLPHPKRQPNLLLGAVRFLGGPVDSWPAFRRFVLGRWDELAATMLRRRTQTNEARRCTALLPVLAALPQPVALLEVGVSAGLCLFPDRWTYRFGDHVVGAGPELSCDISGPVPLPTRLPDVGWRAGLDLDPRDVGDDEDVRWLESLIWPEETDRFRILRDAVAIARAEPPRLVVGDLTRDVPALAAEAPGDATLVIFHSAVLAYVDDAGRAAFADAVCSTGGVWLANEAPGVLPGTKAMRDGSHRFVLCRDGEPIARADGHGATLEWLA